jgi:hypothetical protein
MVEVRDAVYFDLSPGGELLHLQLPKSPTAIEMAVHDRGPLGPPLDEAARWLSKDLEGLTDPGVRFHIALRPDADLLHGHKLSLYAIAVADRIKSLSGRQFSCVKITKGHTAPTTLYVASSVRAPAPTDSVTVTLKTRKSYAKPEYTQVVHEATHPIRAVAASPGPLRLRVSYTTGLPRTWSRLWQPTLTGIFASDPSGNATELDTSRIVQLEFDHRSIGASLDHQVQIAISIAQVKD